MLIANNIHAAMPATTRSVVKTYLSAFNERDEATLSSVLADDVVEHGIHDTVRGIDAVIERLERHHTAFPDYSGTLHQMIVDDDLVSVRYTARGTHTGAYRDVEPTGLEATWTGLAMYRVDDDSIAEIWLEEDRLGLLEQLELVDKTKPAHLRL